MEKGTPKYFDLPTCRTSPEVSAPLIGRLPEMENSLPASLPGGLPDSLPGVFRCAQKPANNDCIVSFNPSDSGRTTPIAAKNSLRNTSQNFRQFFTSSKKGGGPNHKATPISQITPTIQQSGAESCRLSTLSLASTCSVSSELSILAFESPPTLNSPPTFSLTTPTMSPEYQLSLPPLQSQTPPSGDQVPPPIPPSSQASTAPPTPVDLMNMQRFSSTNGKPLPETKSETSLLTMGPVCRICHLPADETDIDALISPCRCAGSLQFIHSKCLEMWLEYSAKKSKISPRCELCRYPFKRHKKIKFHRCRCPSISNSEMVLHVLFFINIFIMIGCAAATVICFVADRGQVEAFAKSRLDLNALEVVTLACGVLFFVSLFTAMLVEIRARRSICQLLTVMIRQNVEWQVDDYDKTKDTLLYRV